MVHETMVNEIMEQPSGTTHHGWSTSALMGFAMSAVCLGLVGGVHGYNTGIFASFYTLPVSAAISTPDTLRQGAMASKPGMPPLRHRGVNTASSIQTLVRSHRSPNRGSVRATSQALAPNEASREVYPRIAKIGVPLATVAAVQASMVQDISPDVITYMLMGVFAVIPLMAFFRGGPSAEQAAMLSVSGSPAMTPDNAAKAEGAGWLKTLYAFSRPHTIKGTILASVMGVCRALAENPGSISMSLVPRALMGLVALLCGNAYIVGINQIYDVNVDKINKPFLPIAAGQLTKKQAWFLVVGFLITGFAIVYTQFNTLISNLYLLGTILGTIYSVPPLTLKRFPIAAGAIIATVRGFLLNFGVYYAVREALSVPFQWNPVVVFIAGFMTIFASVIAVTKDLQDVKGDIENNITTFASKNGVKATATAAAVVLSAAYCGAIALPLLSIGAGFQKVPMMAGHAACLVFFLFSFGKLNPDSDDSVKDFYKAIWKLFYAEYCLYPFI